MFELDKNKLYADVLPSYMDYINAVDGYRWDHVLENREPILIADIEFEWLPDGIDDNSRLESMGEGNYRPKDPSARDIGASTARYFGAALANSTLRDRLITFALTEDFIYTNYSDPITSVHVEIEDQRFRLPIGRTKTIDLGDDEGEHVATITAHHRSGSLSQSSFRFQLARLPGGRWANTAEADDTLRSATAARPSRRTARNTGAAQFAIRPLPAVIFRSDDDDG